MGLNLYSNLHVIINEMKKLRKNEQTKSSSNNAYRDIHATLSVSENKTDDEKGHEYTQSSSFKLKAYHPKMMIAYRAYPLFSK